jgi:hypothetical protein
MRRLFVVEHLLDEIAQPANVAIKQVVFRPQFVGLLAQPRGDVDGVLK